MAEGCFDVSAKLFDKGLTEIHATYKFDGLVVTANYAHRNWDVDVKDTSADGVF